MHEVQGSNPSSLQEIGKEQEGETERRWEKKGEEGERKGGEGRKLGQQTEDLTCPCTLAVYNMLLHNVDYKQQLKEIRKHRDTWDSAQ